MISRTVTYALRTLGYLVDNPGVRSRAEEIAKATGVPANYLSKVLNQLRKRGVVDSEKGWGGGFELRPDALGLPIREIAIVFDGIARLEQKQCVFGLPECGSDHPCPLHPYWERISVTMTEMLQNTKIEDLGRSGRDSSKD
jgi:Rrf2 family protein